MLTEHSQWSNLAKLSLLYCEELVVELSCREDFVEVIAVGVGDEDLSVPLSRYDIHDMLYPIGIELVEDIIKKQYGQRARLGVVLEEFEHCELQGNDVCLHLSL